uniref:Tctex1 domain-containing protein 2 n=1 Tax=Chrysotila carterae TaxID=13221 RepID=A0A7S4FC48_CHRCT|mmetsp:Transcript_35448/g.74404  ORF Transcript_35448/g.74404 Transcript_35448/m.74404 type:complete len:122 (+) Transcript_35448:171-536(+)
MSAQTYSLRPDFKHKFRPAVVKTVIASVLAERLSDKIYNAESTAGLTREISDEIKSKLRTEVELSSRYKLVVQVVIGEQRGEGVRMGARCFWDTDTDSYAEETYRNDSLFCVAAAFGVYLY